MIKEYKIKRYKDSVVGISLGKGTQWSLMRNNPVDYVLDGYQFVNRDFIQEEHIIQDDIMLCKILPLKQKEEKLPFLCNYLYILTLKQTKSSKQNNHIGKFLSENMV